MPEILPSWTFFPDFTSGNPYQACLAETLALHGWAVRPGDIAAATLAARSGQAIFHLHWEQPAYFAGADETEAFALAESFLRALDAFRAAGGVLVWTLHNAAPHEERYPAVNAAMQRGLARRADLVHVHNYAGATHAVILGVPEASILLVRHPSYADTYPDDITDDAARRYLGLRGEDLVFTFFGAMRGYKGLPRLMRAFDLAHAALPDTRLVLAGRCPEPGAARVLAPTPALRLLTRQIADAEVQYVMRAADCVVLPYEAILTSGTLALAQGFGRPVIVPDLPSMEEEVTDGVNGFLYVAGSDGALAAALWRAADNVRALRGHMRAASRATVAGRDFATLAAALSTAVAGAQPTQRAA
ncbi:MAG: glycosyltransferase [Acetobacteraceae bacterium]|nr:glycosyltransferase [Acetobacteraceae bacterium]